MSEALDMHSALNEIMKWAPQWQSSPPSDPADLHRLSQAVSIWKTNIDSLSRNIQETSGGSSSFALHGYHGSTRTRASGGRRPRLPRAKSLPQSSEAMDLDDNGPLFVSEEDEHECAAHEEGDTINEDDEQMQTEDEETGQAGEIGTLDDGGFFDQCFSEFEAARREQADDAIVEHQEIEPIDTLDNEGFFDERYSDLEATRRGQVDDARILESVKRFTSAIQGRQLCLPHSPAISKTAIEVEDFFKPLLFGTPLSPSLMHALLHIVLPSSVVVLQIHSAHGICDFLGIMNPDEPCSIAAVCNEETPWIILATVSSNGKDVVVIAPQGGENLVDTLQNRFEDWSVSHIIPENMAEDEENTISSIYLACKHISPPMGDMRDEADLRERLVNDVIHWYARDPLNSLCMPSRDIPNRKTDERDEQPFESLSALGSYPLVIPEFDTDGLQTVLLNRPADFEKHLTSYLRIFQCIYEIGRPHILNTISATVRAIEGEQLDIEENAKANIKYLTHIHTYLDRQACTSHVPIARSRYVKLRYYRTYKQVVKSLQLALIMCKKERGRREKHKNSATFREGLTVLPQTPISDELMRDYPDIASDGVKSEDLVQNHIVRLYGNIRDEMKKDIKKKIGAYVKEGKRMSFILRGLDPGLLLLFPTATDSEPSLNVDHCVRDDRAALKKNFEVKDLDGLTERKAQWMGRILPILRPELKEQMPMKVLDILGAPSKAIELAGDPNEYVTNPLQFFV